MHNLSKITLHIGMHKTGTSTLQSFLASNREVLEKHKVLYPKPTSHSSHHDLAHLLFPESKFLMRVENRPKFKKLVTQYYVRFIYKNDYRQRLVLKLWAKILKTSRAAGCTHCVLSSEAFLGASPENRSFFIKLLEAEKIQPVIFLRRQDLWIESRLIQRAKVLRTPLSEINKIITRYPANDYYRMIAPWAKLIPKENIKIISFPRDIKEEGIEKSFCNITGIPWDDAYVNVGESKNISLNRDAIEWFINTKDKFKVNGVKYNEIVAALEEYTCEHPIDPAYKFFNSPLKRKELFESHQEGNLRIVEEFLSAGAENLFEEEDFNRTVWKEYPGLSKKKSDEITDYLHERNLHV